jgi:hypothetical protein
MWRASVSTAYNYVAHSSAVRASLGFCCAKIATRAGELPVLDLAPVLVRLDHVAGSILHMNHGVWFAHNL